MCCVGVARYIKGTGERNPVYADGGYQSPSNDRKDIEMVYTGFCLTMNPGMAGAAYSFAGMRPYSGGQANVKSYNRQLCTLISVGKTKTSLIISHELSLGEAPEAYKHFDARDKGWTKVILKPERQNIQKFNEELIKFAL